MKRFLVVIRHAGADPSYLLTVKRILAPMGADGVNLLFSSEPPAFVGLFIKSDRASAQIRAAVANAVNGRGEDFVMVLELGADFSAEGNSAGWRHLQH